MNLVPLKLQGVFGVSSTISNDNRGSFSRIFDAPLFESKFSLSEGSVANNPIERTLRGLHYQEMPYAESKLIQCITGQVFDVLVDIRKNSASFGQHMSLFLGPQEIYQGVFIPKGFAHGYITLAPNSTLLYFMDQPYIPDLARGIIWNDPTLNINWPCEPLLISERDKAFKKIMDQ
jgi:dTDP-4-dehydrorhamnose 3,5-epimerase